jgi:8-oxo-dGTP diphosphatase
MLRQAYLNLYDERIGCYMPLLSMNTHSSSNKQKLKISVGVLVNDEGLVLIAERPFGKHMAGSWEFPGGKVNSCETVIQALSRELYEELEVKVVTAEPLLEFEHEYPDRVVSLSVFLVNEFSSNGLGSVGAEGQLLRWVLPKNLMCSGLLQADKPIAKALLDRFLSV